MNESFDYKEAALPNITGYIDTRLANSAHSIQSGAVVYQTSSTSSLVSKSYGPNNSIIGSSVQVYGYSAIGLDASYSSSIYKNDCTTVQPSAYTVMYIMKMK